MSDNSTPLVIEQDYEVDDGDVGGRLDVFWCEGHGHDEHEFIRAVVEHCLDLGIGLPAIDDDSGPVEMWQQDRPRGDSIEYIRYSDPKNPPQFSRRDECHPVTVLDLDRRGRGAPRCAVRDCRTPFRIGTPVRAVSAADVDETAEPVFIEVYLCRKHLSAIPEPHYRVMMVPVGATVSLSGQDKAAS